MYQLDKGRFGVSSLNYHFIICIKYRRNIFTRNDICERCKTLIYEIAQERNITILEIECGEDHIHVLFRCCPTTDLTEFIKTAKSKTSRVLLQEYHRTITPRLPESTLCPPSYFLATTGNVTIDILKKYVSFQRDDLDEDQL